MKLQISPCRERGSVSVVTLLAILVLIVALAAGLGALATGSLGNQAILEGRARAESNCRAGFVYARTGFREAATERTARAIREANNNPATDWSQPVLLALNFPQFTLPQANVPGAGRTPSDRVEAITTFSHLPPYRARERRVYDGDPVVTDLYEDDRVGTWIYRVLYRTQTRATSTNGATATMEEWGEIPISVKVDYLTDDEQPVPVAFAPGVDRLAAADARFALVSDDGPVGPAAVVYEPATSYEQFAAYFPGVDEATYERALASAVLPLENSDEGGETDIFADEGAAFVPVAGRGNYYLGAAPAGCLGTPAPQISLETVGLNSKGGRAVLATCKYCGSNPQITTQWTAPGGGAGVLTTAWFQGDGWRFYPNYDCTRDAIRVVHPDGSVTYWQPAPEKRDAKFLLLGPNMGAYLSEGTPYFDVAGRVAVSSTQAATSLSLTVTVTNPIGRTATLHDGDFETGVRGPAKIFHRTGASSPSGGEAVVTVGNQVAVTETAVSATGFRWQDVGNVADPVRVQYDGVDTGPEGPEPPRQYEVSAVNFAGVNAGAGAPREQQFWIRDRVTAAAQVVRTPWNGVETPRQAATRLGLVFPSSATVVWSGHVRLEWSLAAFAREDDTSTGDLYDPLPAGVLNAPSAANISLSTVGSSILIQPGAGGADAIPPPGGGPERIGIRSNRITVVAVSQQRIAPELYGTTGGGTTAGPASTGTTSSGTGSTTGTGTASGTGSLSILSGLSNLFAPSSGGDRELLHRRKRGGETRRGDDTSGRFENSALRERANPPRRETKSTALYPIGYPVL